jgi:hypothetical protein
MGWYILHNSVLVCMSTSSHVTENAYCDVENTSLPNDAIGGVYTTHNGTYGVWDVPVPLVRPITLRNTMISSSMISLGDSIS